MKALVLIVAAFATACAGTGLKPVKTRTPFPKEEAVEKLRSQPPPQVPFEQTKDVRVPRWTLTGPLPDTIGPVARQPVDELDRLAAEVASGIDGAVASEPARCVAREVGMFYLHYGGLPEGRLRRFIQHRCGLTAYDAVFPRYTYEEPDLTWDQAARNGELLAGARKDLEQTAGPLSAPEIGGWYGANDKRSAAIFVVAPRTADIKPIPMTVGSDGSFEVAGTLLRNNDNVVRGMVNRGPFGAAPCHALPEKLPRFRVKCVTHGDDLAAAFEIYSAPAGAILSHSQLWQRVWPSGVMADTYVDGGEPVLSTAAAPEVAATEAEPQTASAPPTAADKPEPLEPTQFDSSPEGIRAAVAARVNELRTGYNLPTIELAAEQSAFALELLPHYFAASFRNRVDVAEEIALGILAGRKVSGAKIDGTFNSATSRGGPADFVDSLAERPGARDLLFNEEVAQLSIGASYDGKAGMIYGLIHGWQFVPDESHARRKHRFLDYLAEAREARGNSRAKIDGRFNSLTADLAAKLTAGELEVHEVAHKLQTAVAQKNPGKVVMVYYFEANDPQQLRLSDELLDQDTLKMAMVIAPYQPAGSPWHSYGGAFAYVKRKQSTKVAMASTQ